MATVSHTQTTQDAGLLARVIGWFQSVQENRSKAALYRQTLRELNALSGRDLADLGIHRSSIRRIAYEAAYK